MFNNLIKVLAIFAAGAISGSGITYILVKKKFEKKADDEIAEMKEYYDHHALTYEELVKRGRIADEPKEEKKEENIPQSYRTSAPDEGKLVRGGGVKKAVPIDYTVFYKPEDDTDPAESEHPMDDDEETQKEYQGEVLTKEHQQVKYREPRIIKHSDFGSEPHYTTQTLIYYTEDDILTLGEDQSEEEVADFDEIESMIGDALTKYGFIDNDEDHIYVRNDQRCCDYEIVKVFGSFYDGHPE